LSAVIASTRCRVHGPAPIGASQKVRSRSELELGRQQDRQVGGLPANPLLDHLPPPNTKLGGSN
jgi:hypothetical protein